MVLAYRRQNEESFLEALVRVLQYFGGVPRQVIFDNDKVAVKDGFGTHARKQDDYSALSAHYGFKLYSATLHPETKKGWYKAWSAIFAAMPVSQSRRQKRWMS